jgi:hypothetical protein
VGVVGKFKYVAGHRKDSQVSVFGGTVKWGWSDTPRSVKRNGTAPLEQSSGYDAKWGKVLLGHHCGSPVSVVEKSSCDAAARQAQAEGLSS